MSWERFGASKLVRHGSVSAGLCFAAALGWASPIAAEPPVRLACDQADSGERIKCKFGNIIEQQRGVAELAAQMEVLPESQKVALMKEVDRAGRARGRAPASEFKQLTKKSKVACETQEIVGDGKGDDDGVCTSGEDCVEVVGDQIGDEDGICKPMQGKKREVCVEICDADAVDANPDNFDDDPNVDSRGKDIEETLDGLTDEYAQINQTLQEQRLAQAEAASFAAASGACGVVHRQRPSSVVVAILIGAAEGMRVAADVGERFCDQSAFGFNGAGACAVIEGIAGAAKVVARAFEAEGSDIDSSTIDSIWTCLQQTSETTAAAVGAVGNVAGDIAGLSQQVGVVDARVGLVDQKAAGIDQKVNALTETLGHVQGTLAQVQGTLAEIITLLNTPPGQRLDFPKP